MPFPAHDRNWVEVARFIERHGAPDDALLAPDEFGEMFPTVYPFSASHAASMICVPWVVLHKGQIGAVNQDYLRRVLRHLIPVVANDVFVVYASDLGLPALPPDLDHVRALAVLAEAPRPAPGPAADARPVPKTAFMHLTVEGVRQEMNTRFSRSEHDDYGGYEHPHLWDRVRYAEVDRLFAKHIGPVEGLTVLEVGCGIGRSVGMLAGCRDYTGIDLSDVAVAKARATHGQRPNVRFRQMDAMNLDFADGVFDLVAGVEIIEHVQDAERMLREVFRVLKPGGRFVFDSANRDSLHLRVLRGLGLPELRGTYEHFREFGYAEMTEILRQTGFVVEASDGVFLLPYHCIPGVGAQVVEAANEDPTLVETFRRLGELAGPEYGFEFLIAARKPG